MAVIGQNWSIAYVNDDRFWNSGKWDCAELSWFAPDGTNARRIIKLSLRVGHDSGHADDVAWSLSAALHRGGVDEDVLQLAGANVFRQDSVIRLFG